MDLTLAWSTGGDANQSAKSLRRVWQQAAAFSKGSRSIHTRPIGWFGKALAAQKARDVVKQIFLGAATMAENRRVAPGCLLVQGALRRRLQRAKREGDLPKNADPAELAHYVMTVVRGMAVQSAGGASRDQLHRVAQIALRAWPKGSE